MEFFDQTTGTLEDATFKTAVFMKVKVKCGAFDMPNLWHEITTIIINAGQKCTFPNSEKYGVLKKPTPIKWDVLKITFLFYSVINNASPTVFTLNIQQD